MVKNVFRKSLVTGIIVLFLGASILPVVNSKQIDYEKTCVENSKPLPVLFSFMSNFNITFFGNATRGTNLTFGGLTIANSANCIDTSVQPIANLTWTPLGGKTHRLEISNIMEISFFLIGHRKFETNMNENQLTYHGYISSWALLFGVYFL